MDDVKDKFKGLFKKVNKNISSSSSSKFKGQGHVLGSSSQSQSNIIPSPSPSPNPRPIPGLRPKPSSTIKPTNNNNDINIGAIEFKNSNANLLKKLNRSDTDTGFDPFDSLVTSSKRSSGLPQTDLQTTPEHSYIECPVCRCSFPSENEVSEHIDSCIVASVASESKETVFNEHEVEAVAKVEGKDDAGVCVGKFVNGSSKEGSVEVLLKLLRNVVKEPGNEKFRRVRMSNPKIREMIVEVVGGVELLERVGFEMKEEDGGEMRLVMDVLDERRVRVINEVIELLELGKKEEVNAIAVNEAVVPVMEPVEPKKIDRQVRVFFSVPENIAAKIDLPDSFYKLSVDEVKREADLRKKKMAESQLLIPKSLKEKQAKAAIKRYKTTIIRIQFPDGVVLQGTFLPWELTSSLYEFVSSSLKDPSLEFELWHPAVLRRGMITQFPGTGKKKPTLEEEDLVPSALIKFKPIETDSRVFTGLANELLLMSEPLK